MQNWAYHICTMMIMWQATKNNLWQSPIHFGSALVEKSIFHSFDICQVWRVMISKILCIILIMFMFRFWIHKLWNELFMKDSHLSRLSISKLILSSKDHALEDFQFCFFCFFPLSLFGFCFVLCLCSSFFLVSLVLNCFHFPEFLEYYWFNMSFFFEKKSKRQLCNSKPNAINKTYHIVDSLIQTWVNKVDILDYVIV
jgi:hypothetical protein